MPHQVQVKVTRLPKLPRPRRQRTKTRRQVEPRGRGMALAAQRQMCQANCIMVSMMRMTSNPYRRAGSCPLAQPFQCCTQLQMGESVAVQQEGLAQTISLPGGGSSELDIVMKLHKVERHIRNSKLKVCALVSQASSCCAAAGGPHFQDIGRVRPVGCMLCEIKRSFWTCGQAGALPRIRLMSCDCR